MEQLLGGGGATAWFTVKSERALDADTCDWTENTGVVQCLKPRVSQRRTFYRTKRLALCSSSLTLARPPCPTIACACV